MLPVAECVVDDQLRAIVTRKHEALADAVFALFALNNANQVQSAAVFYCDMIIWHHVLSPERYVVSMFMTPIFHSAICICVYVCHCTHTDQSVRLMETPRPQSRLFITLTWHPGR